MKQIFLLILGCSVLFADFTRDSDGVVTDTVTHLQWQDEYTNNENVDRTHWEEAILYCEELELGGKDDWRLPTINELVSIINYEADSPRLYTIFRNNQRGSWSSTTDYDNFSEAWIMTFNSDTYGYGGMYSGNSGTNTKSKAYVPIRCVRD